MSVDQPYTKKAAKARRDARAGAAMRERDRVPDTLTYDEAVALLPEGDDIHTFLGFIGADWRRAQILDALQEAPEILLTGPMAQAMGHGMAIRRPGTSSPLMIQTIRRTDASR